jgi:hypothetical protein
MLVTSSLVDRHGQDRNMFESTAITAGIDGSPGHHGSPASAREHPTRTTHVRLAMATVLGLSVLAGTASLTLAAPPSDVATPAAVRLWGGCQLTSNTHNAIVAETGGAADFIVAYSLQPNDGQPFGTQVPPVYTGPIVCTAPQTGIKSYTEGTPLPNGDTGGASVDLLNTEQALVVRYSVGGPEKRVCRSVGDRTDCYQVKPQGGGCQLTPTTYDAVVSAIRKGKGIVGTGVSFAFIMAHSVQGFAGSRICAAPGFGASRSGSEAIGPSIDVLDTEESLIVRYKINGGQRNGKTEKRLCHTVANKTDCFRLFR